jgi:excisionase family DNA binding protein
MSDQPEILTMEQVAEMLQVSTRTVQRMVTDGRMPGRQVGSQWRFDRDQIRAWVRGDIEVPVAHRSQGDLIAAEQRRMNIDLPQTLIDMQQAAVRHHEVRYHPDETATEE